MSSIGTQSTSNYTATRGGVPLATFVPMSDRTGFDSRRRFGPGLYVLSRFAWLRREDGELVLESPLAAAKVVLHDASAIALVTALTQPRQMPDDNDELMAILANSGAIVECDSFGVEREPSGAAGWEFHDLLFHSRSRVGRHDNPYGRQLGFGLPGIAVERPEPAEAVQLHVPNLDDLRSAGRPFTDVLESRRSIRAHGSAPITLEQLGEFLFRSARTRADGTRPYPAGGGCYELELYCAVHRCAGLEVGLYRYRPDRHDFTGVAPVTEHVHALLERARAAMAATAGPDVLIVYAARMDKLASRYQGLAYALALKDAGVLQQTMYLVATAMDLAACAIGGGDSDAFARASGRNYYQEPSVAEFALGSLP